MLTITIPLAATALCGVVLLALVAISLHARIKRVENALARIADHL